MTSNCAIHCVSVYVIDRVNKVRVAPDTEAVVCVNCGLVIETRSHY